jgi:hypothetical protein
VKFPEGTAQGFLAMRSTDGSIIASGDLTQTVHGDRVTSRVTFRFKDGSLDDETSVFTERKVFRLITDHHIQKGPSFPKPADVLINAIKGTVTVRYEEKGVEKSETSHMNIPPDIANGAIFDVIKNVPSDRETKLSWIAATPKPRLVKLVITAPDKQSFKIAGTSRKATHFNIHVEIGGISGIIAPLIGKEPDDMSVWITQGDAPTFVKFQGALYLGGPNWRIELESPVWPEASH